MTISFGQETGKAEPALRGPASPRAQEVPGKEPEPVARELRRPPPAQLCPPSPSSENDGSSFGKRLPGTCESTNRSAPHP